MSSRYKLHKERQDAVISLGRDLTRRSKAKCELCGSAGQSLQVKEIEPLPDQPHPDHCLFLCEKCSDDITDNVLDPIRWRFLETIVWSDTAPVQITAIRLCRRLRDQGVGWADDVLANLYVSPEIERRL